MKQEKLSSHRPLCGDRIFRTALWGVLEAFALVTVVLSLIEGDVAHILMSVATVGFLCIPYLVTRFLKYEINLVFFVFCQLYAVGPMLGNTYKLYYLTTWWDDVLHASGGVAFAVAGLFLVDVLNGKQKNTPAMKAVFALMLSIAFAGLWEICEYSTDMLLGTDSQSDTVITEITSYLFGPELGVAGTVTDIREVTINGVPIVGYIDIGLHDTMRDMITESLGALLVAVLYLLDRERHPLVYKPKQAPLASPSEAEPAA